MAWYGLVWLGAQGPLSWCPKVGVLDWRCRMLAGQRWMMAMGPTAIRLFDPENLGCLAVGQLEKPVVGEKWAHRGSNMIKCFVMSESTWICGWWARLSHVSLFNSLAPGPSQLSTRVAMTHGPLFSATKSQVAARNLQNPLFQWQQLCPLTAKEEGAFALGGHKMSVII